MRVTIVAAILLTLFAPGIAQAYVGPGLGLGAAVAVVAVIFSGVVALLAIVWYPLKRLYRKRKMNERPQIRNQAPPGSDG